MAQNYTVQTGDNLSTIAQRFGVDYKQISGYKSGNPNLIYPGEVLNIPDKTNPAVPANPTSANPASPTSSVSPSVTPTSGSMPSKFDINPTTGKQYGINPATGVQDDNYWANVVEPQLKSSIGTSSGTTNTIDVVGLYDAAMKDPALLAQQAKIRSIQSKIDVKNKALADAEATINENPFYSEATRTGKINKTDLKAQRDLGNLTNELSVESNNLSLAKADAQNKINIALKQYDINSQATQQALQKFTTLLNAGALQNASASDIASFTLSTGIPTSMIQSAIAKQKADNIKTQVISSTDDAGNLTFAIINSQTGEVINKNTLSGVGKSKEGSSSGSVKQQFLNDTSTITGTKSPSGWIGQFPLLVAKYAPYLSLQDIYQYYSVSDLGKKYGTPKEDASYIKQLYTQARGSTK